MKASGARLAPRGGRRARHAGRRARARCRRTVRRRLGPDPPRRAGRGAGQPPRALGHRARRAVAGGRRWLLGALARRGDLGAAAGAFALVGGTGAWYAFTVWSEGRASLGYAVPVSIGWAAAAALAGAIFGAAGALWRSRRQRRRAGARRGDGRGAADRRGGAARDDWDGRAARVVLTAELIVGLVLPFVLVAPPAPRAAAVPRADRGAVGRRRGRRGRRARRTAPRRLGRAVTATGTPGR